jgi:DinB superfamily
MTRAERQSLIERYRAGYDEVVRSLEGFPPAALTTQFLAGKWTAAEIVHHLSDSENISAQRIRKLIAEEHPLIRGYDQENLAVKLKYNERDIAPALDCFRTARATTSQLFDLMSESDWTRAGYHTDSGPYTAERWLEIYAAHAHGHADQIRRLRELAKK